MKKYAKEYKMVKSEESSIDLLSLKSEVESLIKKLQDSSGNNRNMIVEAEDMLIDITRARICCTAPVALLHKRFKLKPI